MTPRTLDASVMQLLALWSAELPASIHRNEVFVGRPDDRHLAAQHSTADQLVGGSLLGAPAYSEPMRHLLEDDNPHREEPSWSPGEERLSSTEKHLVTPLRSALRRCGHMMEAYLTEIARNGGDWFTPAVRRGCSNEDIARVYANEAFRRLWREYQVQRPARVPRRERRSSDDVPWTEKSEAQQVAEDAA